MEIIPLADLYCPATTMGTDAISLIHRGEHFGVWRRDPMEMGLSTEPRAADTALPFNVNNCSWSRKAFHRAQPKY